MFQKGNKLWDNPKSKKNQFRRGQTSWTKGKTKEDTPQLKILSEKMKNNKLWNNSNSRERWFEPGVVPWIKGKKQPEELKKYLSEKMKGKHYSQKTEFKKGAVPWTKGKKKEDNETLKRISLIMKEGGALKARMANKGKPSKPELLLKRIIKTKNLPFNHNSEIKVWFKGEHHYFNPDFINQNQRIIIEVFGDYWHNLPDKKEIDKERLETYSKEGYKTLVVWEHELKNPQIVINKINKQLTG